MITLPRTPEEVIADYAEVLEYHSTGALEAAKMMLADAIATNRILARTAINRPVNQPARTTWN